MRFGLARSPKLVLCFVLALIVALPALAVAAPVGHQSLSNSAIVTSSVSSSLGAANVALTGPGAPLPPFPPPPGKSAIALTGPGAPLPPFPPPPGKSAIALTGPGAPLPPFPPPPGKSAIALTGPGAPLPPFPPPPHSSMTA